MWYFPEMGYKIPPASSLFDLSLHSHFSSTCAKPTSVLQMILAWTAIDGGLVP
jgi:hypothetical protein